MVFTQPRREADSGRPLRPHYLDLALDVVDYAYVLDRGRVALEGRSSAVRNDSQLLQLLAP